MFDENNNQEFGCLQKLLAITIIVMVCLVSSLGLIWRYGPNSEPMIVIRRQQQPTPEPTPNPVYLALVEQAKASARVQVITAETDNEIRLRWNVHFMRRWWALWVISIGLIFVGLGIAYLGLRYGRE